MPRKRKNELSYPTWIMEALSVLKPPEKMTVSEWADKYRVLSELDSALPGKWRTSKTPYLREVMDAYNKDYIHDITFCAGTQLGKTAAEQNMIAFSIAQDPGPMLIVYPTKDLAKFTSEKRLQPMFRLCPELAKKFDERHSQDLELNLGNMYIALVGANSAAGLAARPARYVFFDEIDKFPKWTGAEAGPLELAEERTKTFWNAKKVKVSTPTLKTGYIWQGWLNADVQYRYYVPCPHCGAMQTFKMGNVRWPDDADQAEARESAYYECEECHGVIDDRHKPQMLREGEWRGETKVKGRPRKVAFHLNSIYSPWLSFGDVAAKFIASENDPPLLMNFINSWLAEPWVDKANRLRSDVVKSKQLPYEQGTMPEAAQIVTCGVDVQLDHFWYSVRAWGPHMTSWLVDYGRLETWADVEKVLDRNYADSNGEIRNINLACIDSGYNTDEVYQFCTEHMGLAVPTKGSSNPLKSRYTVTVLDKGMGYGLRLYSFDPNQMKDYIAGRLAVDAGASGSWNVCLDVEQEYCDQVCAEQKVEHKDKKGKITLVWEKISSHAANHYLDTETNNILAAEIMGVRYLQEQEKTPPEKDGGEENWLGNIRDNWL